MTTKITATEAKAKLLSLLDDASNGEEIEITKRGRTVARLIPAGNFHALKDSFSGIAVTAADDDDLLTTGESWESS